MDDFDVGPGMVNYAVYVIASGKITQHGSCVYTDQAFNKSTIESLYPGSTTIIIPASVSVDKDFDVNNYLDLSTMTIKAKSSSIPSKLEYTIAADNVAKVSFPVSPGSKVLFNGAWVAISDNLFEFTTGVAGDYELIFYSAPQYKDFTVIIHAV